MIACAIQFKPDGSGVCLATDTIPLNEIGSLVVTRASQIEFNHAKQVWEVCWANKPGKVVFQHASRKACLDWEVSQLNKRILGL
jgi:hypothetical protein